MASAKHFCRSHSYCRGQGVFFCDRGDERLGILVLLLAQVPQILSQQGEVFMVTVAENDPAGESGNGNSRCPAILWRLDLRSDSLFWGAAPVTGGMTYHWLFCWGSAAFEWYPPLLK